MITFERVACVFFITFLAGLNGLQFQKNPVWNEDYQQVKDQIDLVDDIIEVNGEIFDKIGILATITSDNTTTMMRYAHFTDGHTEEDKGTKFLCPECAVPSTLIKESDLGPEAELTDIPETLEQVLSDAEELKQSISTFIFSGINQDIKLRSTLHKLRHPDGDYTDMHKLIYKPLSHYGIEMDEL